MDRFTTARDLMTPRPARVRAETPLDDAILVLEQLDVRHLPVVDSDDQVIGMVSDRDLRALDRPSVARVAEVMSGDPATVGLEASVEEIVDLLLERRIGAVPVVDSDGRIAGIVSYVDVLRGAREPDEARPRTLPRMVRDLMSAPVVTVRTDAPLQSAQEAMQSALVHHLVVLDGERLAGVLTEHDLRAGLALEGAIEGERHFLHAGDVIHQPPRTIRADAPASAAAAVMIAAHVSCLPVVDGARLVGMITSSDFLALARRILDEPRREPGELRPQ
jgi:acetoin utilization protein AcuB